MTRVALPLSLALIVGASACPLLPGPEILEEHINAHVFVVDAHARETVTISVAGLSRTSDPLEHDNAVIEFKLPDVEAGDHDGTIEVDDAQRRPDRCGAFTLRVVDGHDNNVVIDVDELAHCDGSEGEGEGEGHVGEGEGEGEHGGEGEGEPAGEGEGEGDDHGGSVAFITSPEDGAQFDANQSITFACAAHSAGGDVTDSTRFNWHIVDDESHVEVTHFPGNHPPPVGLPQGRYKVECDLLGAPDAVTDVIAKDDNVTICVAVDGCS